MNVLEQRYRFALRMLPASYRQAWEDDMVATFLASMQTDDPDDAEFLANYGRPSWPEVASVAMLAVRLRIGGVGLPPLSLAWGEAVRALRLVALTVLLVSAVLAQMNVAVTFLFASEIWVPDGPPAAPIESWLVAWSLTDLLWVAAYFALVFGWWRTGRLFTLLALVSYVPYVVQHALAGFPVLSFVFQLLVSAFLLLPLIMFHRDTPPVRRRPWLIAFAVGIALTPVFQLVFWTMPTESRWLLDWPGLYSVLIVTAAFVYLAGQAFGRGPAPSWALALALLALATAVMRAVSLWEYAVVDMGGAIPLALGVVQTVAVLAGGLTLAALASRGLRRFPLLDAAATPTLDK